MTGTTVDKDFIEIEEQGTDPATPQAGHVRIFAKSSDSLIYQKDDTGTTTAIGGGGSGGYTLLDSDTLGSAAASMAISSISASYTHLELIIAVRVVDTVANGENIAIQLNGDTGANYDWWVGVIGGTGTSAGQTNATQNEWIAGVALTDKVGNDTGVFYPIKLFIPNYANTSNKHTFSALSHTSYDGSTGLTTVPIRQHGGIYRGTAAAISSITIAGASTNLATGSSYWLYGIG